MLLPLLTWAATGIIFLTKPGYEGAYERLSIQTLPINENIVFTPKSNWQEVKLLRTSLGLHLLAKTKSGFKQYDIETMEAAEAPTSGQIQQLIQEAVTSNSERYGSIQNLEGLTATTNTNIKITLNWDTMTLKQYGQDRQLIETLYKIHYLQWTPWDNFNEVFGVLGLAFLVTLTVIGLTLYLSKRKAHFE